MSEPMIEQDALIAASLKHTSARIVKELEQRDLENRIDDLEI